MTTPTRIIPVRELEVGERMDMFEGFLLVTAVTPTPEGLRINFESGAVVPLADVRVDFADGSAVTLPVGANVRILGAGT